MTVAEVFARELGQWLRYQRRTRLYSQMAFGQRVGCSQSTISELELGRSSPTVYQLLQILRVLGEPLSLTDVEEIYDRVVAGLEPNGEAA